MKHMFAAGITAVAALALMVPGLADDAAPTPSPAGTLTHQSLGTLVRNLGYEVEDQKTTDGDPVYHCVSQEDGWTFVADVVLTHDQNRLCFELPLGKSVEVAQIPQITLSGLLEENRRAAPAFFAFNGEDHRFYLYQLEDNRELSPARVRTDLNRLFGIVRRTENLWSPAKWSQSGPAAK